MAVNTKLLLAEAFDLAKRAEAEELRAETMQQGWLKSTDRDVAKLKASYKRAYNTYIESLERFNSVRKHAADTSMQTFCADNMPKYLKKCERVKEKETNILLPATLSTPYKDGYVLGSLLFERRASDKLKPKEEITYETTLGPGTYYLNVKYSDRPAVASPTILAQVAVDTCRGATLKYNKHLPAFTQWSRNIGIAGADAPARMRLKITSNSWVRALHLQVVVQSLKEAGDGAPDVVAPPLPPYSQRPAEPLDALPSVPATALGMPSVPGGDIGGGGLLSGVPPQPAYIDPMDISIPSTTIERGPDGPPAEGPPPPPVTLEELEALSVPPPEGPGWDAGVSSSETKALPPPPSGIAELALPSPPVDAVGAVVRAADDIGGTGAHVPMHSCCPESMTTVQRIAGSVADWPADGPKDEALAGFLGSLPKPTALDPPAD